MKVAVGQPRELLKYIVTLIYIVVREKQHGFGRRVSTYRKCIFFTVSLCVSIVFHIVCSKLASALAGNLTTLAKQLMLA